MNVISRGKRSRHAGWPAARMLALLLVAGCSSHRQVDSLAGPNAPYDPTGSDKTRAEEIGKSSLGIMIDTFALLPDWAVGHFTGIESTTGESTAPTYDASQKAWVFVDSLNIGALPDWYRTLSSYSVQYMKNRSAQEDYQTADEMWIRIYQTIAGHAESAGGAPDSYSMDYNYQYTLTGRIQQLPGLPFTYSGEGGMSGSVNIVSVGTTKAYSYLATYSCDLTLDEGGCPSGTVNIVIGPTANQYAMGTVFQGSNPVAWTLYKGIATVSQGTLPAHCWAPPRGPERPLGRP